MQVFYYVMTIHLLHIVASIDVTEGIFWDTLNYLKQKFNFAKCQIKKLHISSKILHNLWYHNFKFYWKGKEAYFLW